MGTLHPRRKITNEKTKPIPENQEGVTNGVTQDAGSECRIIFIVTGPSLVPGLGLLIRSDAGSCCQPTSFTEQPVA